MIQKIKTNVQLNDIHSKQGFVYLTGNTKMMKTKSTLRAVSVHVNHKIEVCRR